MPRLYHRLSQTPQREPTWHTTQPQVVLPRQFPQFYTKQGNINNRKLYYKFGFNLYLQPLVRPVAINTLFATNVANNFLVISGDLPQLIQYLQSQRDRCGRAFHIIPIKPNGDKVSRLTGCSTLIENGTLQFPQNEKTWWNDFKKEQLGFPGTKYKDQVDALTQCINYAQALI